jgi:hypothetical protein
MVRKLCALALMLGALFPVLANAQAPHDGVRVGNHLCSTIYSVKDYKRIAGRIYRHKRIPLHAQYRLAELRLCQHPTKWAHRQVRILREHFHQERLWLGCNQTHVVTCIVAANSLYGGDLNHQIACARSESGLYAYAKNPRSDASGVFQFMPSTFARTLARMGLRLKSIWSARWNSAAGVWKTARDGYGEWTGSAC